MKRDLYWDTLKFVLIFLIVCVHTIEHYAYDGGILHAFYNFCVLFIMPLFVFISGRFSQIKDRIKNKKGIIKILETYFVFQALKCFLPKIWDGTLSLGTFIHFIVDSEWTLWYLLSLASWRFLLIIISPDIIEKRKRLVLSLCFIVSILGGLMHTEFLDILYTTALLPFFFLGYYSNTIDIKKYILNIPYALAIVLVFTVYLIVFFFFNIDLKKEICYRSYWSILETPLYINIIIRILHFVISTILGMMIMRLVKTNSVLSKWGQKTLGIYIYHSSIVLAMVSLINRGILPQNELILFAYATIVVFGILFLLRYKIFTIMLNPISYFMNNDFVYGRKDTYRCMF